MREREKKCWREGGREGERDRKKEKKRERKRASQRSARQNVPRVRASTILKRALYSPE